MMLKLVLRMIGKTTPRILFKFIYYLGIKSIIGLNKFKKRLKKGKLFPAFIMLSITSKCNLKCQGCWMLCSKNHEISLDKINEVRTFMPCLQNKVRLDSMF